MAGRTSHQFAEDYGLDPAIGISPTVGTFRLGLITSLPTTFTGAYTEVTELETNGVNGYTRPTCATMFPNTPNSDGTVDSDAEVVFGPFTADLGTVVGLVCYRDTTATSDWMWYVELDAPINPANGDSIAFPVGSVSIGLDETP